MREGAAEAGSLGDEAGIDPVRGARLLDDLEREGFVTREDGVYRIVG